MNRLQGIPVEVVRAADVQVHTADHVYKLRVGNYAVRTNYVLDWMRGGGVWVSQTSFVPLYQITHIDFTEVP